MKPMVALLTGALILASLAGCGGKPNKDPNALARAYINLMKAGKWKEAALLWDYSEYARRENPDWDTIGQSQRKLITNKMADEKAQSLQMWSTRLGDAKVETVEVSGEQARAVLNGQIGELTMAKIGEEWFITGMD